MTDHRIRPPTDTDTAFIRSSWRRSYHRSLPMLDPRPYNAVIDKRMDAISESGARIAVACCAKDSDYIIGWLCYGPAPGVVHYAYVRESERLRGTLSSLLASAADDIGPAEGGAIYATHWTAVCEKIARRHRSIYYEPTRLEKL